MRCKYRNKTESRKDKNKIGPSKSHGAFYVRYPELPELDAASCFFLVDCRMLFGLDVAIHCDKGGDRASHSIFYLSSIAMKTSKNEKEREKKPLCDYFKSSTE